MSSALQDSFARADRFALSFNREAQQLYTRAMGGGSMSGSPEAAYGQAAGQDPFSNMGQQAQFLRLYRAASRDHQYTAIRPVAVKVAEQSLRIARKTIEAAAPAGLMTKAFQDPPAFIRKALEVEGLEIVQGHWLDELLESPNQYMTRWALLYCTAFSMEACGEAIWWMDFNPEGGRSIWYLPRHWVRPIAAAGDPYGSWKLTIPGVADNLPPIPGPDVVRFQYPNPADPTGSHSPVASQSRAINTDDHIQDAQLASMKNSIRPTVAIEIGEVMPVPGSSQMVRPELTPEQRKQVIEAIRLAYRGSMHHGDPIILDALIAGIHQVFPSPAELDFMNGSQLTRDRIMEGIGTNPIVAGRVEGANRASAAVAHEGFYDLKVNPLLELLSQVMTQRIGPRIAGAGEKLYCWLTRARARDADLQLRQLQVGSTLGYISPNEFREAIDFPPDQEIERAWREKQKAGVESAKLAANPPPAPALTTTPEPGAPEPEQVPPRPARKPQSKPPRRKKEPVAA